MKSRAESKNIALTTDIADEIPTLYGDGNKIKQVALNLLSNAIKYNRPNGQINLQCESNSETVIFSIQDTGRGILPEHINSLFEKFYRIPGSEQIAQGTGLGLSICKKIIDSHKGNITVESEFGKGTTFTVSLPTNQV